MATPTELLLQEVFILATGTAANADQLAWLTTLMGPQGNDPSQLVSTVNAYMDSLVPAHGAAKLVKTIAFNGPGLWLDDTTANQIAQGLQTQGANSWAALFAHYITLENGPGQVLNNRASAAQNFVDTLHSNNRGAVFNSAEASNTVRNLLQTIGESGESLAMAQRGLSEFARSISAPAPSGLLASAQAQSKTTAGFGAVANSGTPYVNTLDSTYYWRNKTQLTYSFNDSIPAEYKSDPLALKYTDGWRSLNSTERQAVRSALTDIDTFIDIDFQEVASNGDIRFNVVTIDSNFAGFANYPGNRSLAGDVFLGGDIPGMNFSEGARGYALIVHEMGHALGLKHPFEAPAMLPSELDNQSVSVMSYTRYRYLEFTATWNAGTGRYSGEYLVNARPTQLSLFDVQAMHAVYGPETSTRTGNDVYTVGNRQYLTIWDAGGVDTIDVAQATGASRINLNGGTISSVNVQTNADIIARVLADLARQGAPERQSITDWVTTSVNKIASDLYNGENNLAIVQGAVIENVNTGSGNDQVWDNAVNNRINTGAGNDTINLGHGGFDWVDGGSGQDTAVFNVTSAATQRERQSDGSWLVVGKGFAAQLVGVEVLQFTDQQILV